MAVRALAVLMLVVLPGSLAASAGSLSAANPVRKVVNMLQAMAQKVAAEGEKEQSLFDKYMCYCKTGASTLQGSLAANTAKVPAVAADIKAAEAQQVQLKADVKQHQADRSAAKAAMKEATAIRDKEGAAFAAEKADSDANIAAIGAAVGALTKGMAGGFLQTGTAQVVRKLALASENMLDADRTELLSFLAGEQGTNYSPQSGEITGILKAMGDEMSKGLAEATAAEEASAKAHSGLMEAKKKEIDVLGQAIETKMQRSGEVAVSIVQMKNDMDDAEAALVEDRAFLADMDKNCAAKKAEWDERVKTRADELVALHETIKILNDDDALDLFKKTLPSASASLMQVAASSAALRSQALAVLQKAGGAHLDFITLALRGKQMGFQKVIKMIDAMVVTLKGEQADDASKREYCGGQFDTTDDKKKALEGSLADLETAIEDTKEGIAATAADIASLEDAIKALDKSVLEASQARKEESDDYTELMASDGAAKELLGFAKNRLNKFYNPALYKPPPKRELTEEQRITVNMGGTLAPTAAPGGIAGTGISAAQLAAAPPPPPETFGAYAKKSEESGGVTAMIDLLVRDLDKEMTEARTAEKDAQADYEKAMGDAAEQRATDARSLTDKASAKAAMEADLQAHTEAQASAGSELQATLEYISSLHSECDWLLKYFDARTEARNGEIDALGNAKAVLSGADYSLLQTKRRNILRHQ